MGERDELVKRIFPELRRRCKARFVELLEVDLRWGITEDQSKKGDTLRICLQEIDRCRPSAPVFFIGMLGERYGWIPPRDFFKEDVLEDKHLGWVKNHMPNESWYMKLIQFLGIRPILKRVGGRSVTELEILHGVLRHDDMKDKAFFYFRKDGYEKNHWPAIEKHHEGITPVVTPEDFTNAKAPDPAADELRQRDLKKRIQADSALAAPPRPYETPTEMCEMVLEDLWKAIDTIFPADKVPDALERETLEHRVFCKSRTRAYVEREGLFDELDAHARGEGPQCRVVLGGSGSGKSALLAAWLGRHDDQVVFYHFIGGTPQSTSADAILHRLLETLRRGWNGRPGIVPANSSIPSDPQMMAALLPEWLEKLSDAGGGVLLFDAVNQLSSAADRELWWWPSEWPENVRVVFSTLPGDALRAMERRGWTDASGCIAVPPLRPEEKRQVMEHYLKQFNRELEAPLIERILAAPQTGNPLFLRTLLDELRLRSTYEALGKNLDAMLACEDTTGLFVHVLKKIENDFSPAITEANRDEVPERLVHRTLGLMGRARRGLAETELLELLSQSGKPSEHPLARHYWSPLYLALEESLVSRDGQLNFFHDYLRQAVQREYLDEPEERRTADARLAETVLRWGEGTFGPGLRAYGYAYGIGHLLATGRLKEAADLLLDPLYRRAAALGLRDPASVMRDTAEVRRQIALQTPGEIATGVSLTLLALTGREEMVAALREELDRAAKIGTKEGWEEVAAIAEAAPTPAERVLLGLRAVSTGKEPTEEFSSRLESWIRSSGQDEWKEVGKRMIDKK
jgi:nephrocystin-3